MSILLACAMPPLMLALIFFLARIEERHLTVRTRAEPAPGPETSA